MKVDTQPRPSPSLLSWFRKQYVSHKVFQSRTENILYGVPQGSNLGPLLFLNNFNDLSFFFFFQRPIMSMRVAGAAAPNKTATHHGPPPLPTFRLVEVPSGSILDPQCSLPIVFVVVPLPFSLLLSQVKLFWEAFPEAFCLHGQTI